jgi:hypothetical protein
MIAGLERASSLLGTIHNGGSRAPGLGDSRETRVSSMFTGSPKRLGVGRHFFWTLENGRGAKAVAPRREGGRERESAREAS